MAYVVPGLPQPHRPADARSPAPPAGPGRRGGGHGPGGGRDAAGAEPRRRATTPRWPPSARRWCPSDRSASPTGPACAPAGSAPRKPLIQRFAAARTTLDLGGPVVEQLAAAHLVRRPGRAAAGPAGRAPGEPGRAAGPACASTCRTGSRNGPPAACPSGAGCPPPISTALTVIAPGVRHPAGRRAPVRRRRRLRALPRRAVHPAAGQLETAVLALRSAQDRLDAAPQLRRTLQDAPAVAIA